MQPMAADHIYTSVVVSEKISPKVQGYAGNQPPGGRQFPTGGGFWYSEDGGPGVTTSVEFTVPYKWFTFTIGLGNESTKGLFVNVPNYTDSFKLYVEKTFKVSQVNIYKQININSPKILESINYIPTLNWSSQYAKKVN